MLSKTSQAFVKAAMRSVNTIYGGEMSTHRYFRDFAYYGSRIIPSLLVWECVSMSKRLLSDLIYEKKNRFPSSGELKFLLSKAAKLIERVKNQFASIATLIDELDDL